MLWISYMHTWQHMSLAIAWIIHIDMYCIQCIIQHKCVMGPMVTAINWEGARYNKQTYFNISLTGRSLSTHSTVISPKSSFISALGHDRTFPVSTHILYRQNKSSSSLEHSGQVSSMSGLEVCQKHSAKKEQERWNFVWLINLSFLLNSWLVKWLS